tara:strand:+ start:685 stop:2076 length:1392 start_codon:yes stop_codon:yes gene_type:complete
MANSDLIKGAGKVYASQATNMADSFSKSLEKGIARYQQIAQAKKQEKAAINSRTANFINKLNSTIDVTNLDGAQQQAVTDFLVEGRNEYASLAGQVAKMDPDSGGYMDAVSRMNDIQMSFQTLAGNINMYKKDRVAFLEDFDNGMLSEGNEVNTLGEISNIYTEGSNFSVSAGGGLQFFDEATGINKNYSDIQKPFLKDFASADAIMKMNESLYSSGKSLTGARRNMIEQKLKNIISKGGREALMSLASDDFIMEGGLGLQDPMLFEPENQDALKQAVIDGYMNVLSASADQGAADKAPKTGGGSGIPGLDDLSPSDRRDFMFRGEDAIKTANLLGQTKDVSEIVKILNGSGSKNKFLTVEDFLNQVKPETITEDEIDQLKARAQTTFIDAKTLKPVDLDILDQKAKALFYINNTDFGPNLRKFLIDGFNSEVPSESPETTDPNSVMSDQEKAQELINKYANS